jgi:uncharacterized protein (TIGR03086 family)
MGSAAEDHRIIAGVFTDRVRGVSPGDWDAPAPCEGWVARDVVRHLTEWFPAFLAAGAGITLAKGPSVDEKPVAAWTTHSTAVQALLDDPRTAEKVLKNRHLGEIPVPDAVAMFYTSDVFLHTWDLSRATGQDEHLDPGRCAMMLEGMLGMDEALRQSGHYGPKVAVPPTADPQTRLLAFIGRHP